MSRAQKTTSCQITLISYSGTGKGERWESDRFKVEWQKGKECGGNIELRPYRRLAERVPHILIAKLIQIGFVLNPGPEA